VRGIFFLRRRKREWIRPFAPAEAALAMLGCVLCFREDEKRARDLLRAVGRIAKAVPCFRLSYDRKRTTFRELSRRLRAAVPPVTSP
jgi:hypothetical protein